MGTKVYQLISTGHGFSNASIGGRGDSYFIAASSAREAYYCAYRETRATGPDLPTGIVEIRWGTSAVEHWLWCGYVQSYGLGLMHGDGQRIVMATLRTHLAVRHRKSAEPAGRVRFAGGGVTSFVPTNRH